MSGIASDDINTWFDPDELAHIRRRLPIVYVDVVPVRVDADGTIQQVATLLRTPQEESIKRALVSGRVMYHERIADALARHLDKDLGPMALPRLPVSPVPFTVAEYFPTPGITPYHDARQHAISLAYIVPIDGDCAPAQNVLEISWLAPEEAVGPDIQAEMVGGHGALIRQALSHTGRIV